MYQYMLFPKNDQNWGNLALKTLKSIFEGKIGERYVIHMNETGNAVTEVMVDNL